MQYASTFLAHSLADAPFVHAVADALVRRGILAWLDVDEMLPGSASLGAALAEIARRGAVCTVFLSKRSIQSAWAQDEVQVVFETTDAGASVILVTLDRAVPLIRSRVALSQRWMAPDGRRLDRLVIDASKGEGGAPKSATMVADQIADVVYRHLALSDRGTRTIGILLDQRGWGPRRGKPQLDLRFARASFPCLVYQPDRRDRTPGDTLVGAELAGILDDLRNSLHRAIGQVRDRGLEVHLLGDAQLSLAFAVGLIFDRRSGVTLRCHGSRGLSVSNAEYPRWRPLEGGNAQRVSEGAPLSPLPPGVHHRVALFLGPEHYVGPVLDDSRVPLVWLPCGYFDGDDDVRRYLADVVALLERLRRDHGVRALDLYCALPSSVVPLLASQLSGLIDITYWEFRRDIQGASFPDDGLYSPVHFFGERASIDLHTDIVFVVSRQRVRRPRPSLTADAGSAVASTTVPLAPAEAPDRPAPPDDRASDHQTDARADAPAVTGARRHVLANAQDLIDDGRPDEAIARLEDLRRSARVALGALCVLAEAYEALGNTAESDRLAARLDSPAERALLDVGRAVRALGRGDGARARVFLDAASAELLSPAVAAAVEHFEGDLALFDQDLDRAERRFNTARYAWRTLGRADGEAAAAASLGLVAWQRGELLGAERWLRHARVLADGAGWANELLQALLNPPSPHDQTPDPLDADALRRWLAVGEIDGSRVGAWSVQQAASWRLGHSLAAIGAASDVEPLLLSWAPDPE